LTAGRISATAYGARIERSQTRVAEERFGALLIGVGPELQWLTGYAARGMERLTLLIVPPHGRPTLVVPRLEEAAARNAPGIEAGLVDLVSWAETEDPMSLVAKSLAGGSAHTPDDRMLVSDGLRAAFLLRLRDALGDATFGVASRLLGPLRAIKDTEEQALLRDAAHAADRTVQAIASGRLVGRTEADVAREVRERLVDEGHDEAAFWIVASGPNSASPHHEPGSRVIGPGEPIVLDIGGHIGGYFSDITRTIWVTGGDTRGEPDDEFRRVHGLVQAAQAAGRRAVRPGVAAEDLDRTARQIIDEGGYGEQFLHRLGHGIGLEVHEEPYLVEGNGVPIEVGNAFSVEPGIYLDGRYGARIEDIVICARSGAETLNATTRDLLVVSGT
jgi:Xaa-Pro aminopeptidase